MSVSYETFDDILDDVLFRVGELDDSTASEYVEPAKRYILRGYSSIVSGDADLLPESVDPGRGWWWLLKQGELIIPARGRPVDAIYDLPDDFEDFFPELGVMYTNRRNDSPIYLNTNSGMFAQRRSRETEGNLGIVPTFFSLLRQAATDDFESTIKVQFDADGPVDEALTLSYQYYQTVYTDTFEGGNEPLMPKQYRKILADYAIYFLMIDKNDDRAQAVGQLVQNSLRNMLRESQRRTVNATQPLFGVLRRPVPGVIVRNRINIENAGDNYLAGGNIILRPR